MFVACYPPSENSFELALVALLIDTCHHGWCYNADKVTMYRVKLFGFTKWGPASVGSKFANADVANAV